MKKYVQALGAAFMLLSVVEIHAQKRGADSLLSSATLDNCVQYALKNYPLVKQNELDEQITDRQIKSKLADWYPQVNLNANYQNTFQLQTISTSLGNFSSGAYNSSYVNLGATQNLFNRDALLAFKSKNDVKLQAHQTSVANKIDVVVNVSKAFYNVLLTQRQLEVLREDTIRLSRSLKDAYNSYKAGISDKVDYKQATISLNNSTAQLKATHESLKANVSMLKQLMNYPSNEELNLAYDSSKMEQEINIDTTATPAFENRIEYQQLITQKRLQEANLSYQKWSYVPTLSLFANYNMNYFNNRFSSLYKDNFPQSYAGVTLGFPIFQGTKRTQNIRAAELQLTRVDYDIVNVKNQISTQYEQALASYKSNLINYYALRDNLQLAQEVYNTIALQYKSGVKKYLDVINAQTDLRSASINYANALYQVLSSKLDVEKSLGIIQFN